MATERFDKFTIDQLKKRENVANKSMIASFLIFLVCFIGLVIIKPDLSGVTIPILAPAVIAIRERKKIIKVLFNRIESREEELKNLKNQIGSTV